MTAKLIKDEFVNEVLNDPDYEDTIIKNIFEILNKESFSDHIYDHDLYNLICSMRLKNCEILFRSYDFNLEKIKQILGILGGYKSSSIATLASSLNFIGDAPNDFVTELIEHAIKIFINIKQLYNGASDKNNWILLEEIFDILKKYLIKGDDQINLNIVLNEYLPFRVFVDKTNFITNYQTQTNFLVNKLFSIPKPNDGEPYYEVTNYFNIEEKIIIRKKPGKTSEIDNYFKFDLKEIIRIFLKDLPIEFVYLNKILNPKGTPSSKNTMESNFKKNMEFFFNPINHDKFKEGSPTPPTPPPTPTTPTTPEDLFPELLYFKSINDILSEGHMYEIFKLILSIKIKSPETLKKIRTTTLNGDRLCRSNYYDIINEKIIELQGTLRRTATPPSSPNPIPGPSRPTSLHKIILGAATKVSSVITIVKKKKNKIVSKIYEFIIKGILIFLKKKGVDLSDFTTQVRSLTVVTLNFETIDKLISILLKNENLRILTNIIKDQTKNLIGERLVGELCIDYVSYLHYILPIQKNIFKLSLGTNFFSYKFNKMLQECPNSVQKYFKYNKMKIDLMEYIIKEQDLSNLYDGVELALVYLIIVKEEITYKEDPLEFFTNYMNIDTIKWVEQPHEQARSEIMEIFESDGFKDTDVKWAMFESITSITEDSTIENTAFYSNGTPATENDKGIENIIKGYKIQLLEGENSLVNFFINNPYWLGSAALATATAGIFLSKTAINICKRLVGPALNSAYNSAYNSVQKLYSQMPGLYGGGKRTRKYRKNQTRKAKRNRHGKKRSHKRNKNKHKNKKTKRS
jgi:hypothetical protein